MSNGRVFIDMRAPEPGAPDGMKVDREGNIYCTGSGGFWIISSEGKCLAKVRPPELPANLAWGNADMKSLYMTARTGLYRVKLNIAGVPLY